MKRSLKDFEYSYYRIGADTTSRNYSYGDFVLIRDPKPMQDSIPRETPLRALNYRIVRTITGHGTLSMNLAEHHLCPGYTLITPPNTIMRVLECDEDLRSEVIGLPTYITKLAYNDRTSLPNDVVNLMLEREEEVRIDAMFDMLEHYVLSAMRSQDKSQTWTDCINHLLLTLVYDLCRLANIDMNVKPQTEQKTETFREFMALLNENGTRERNIGYYAERLNLSNALLSNIVLEQSGRSVSDWLVQTTLMEAKMLLLYTDLMIFEISDRLNFSEASAFVRFFRHHTGKSPGSFRKER